MLLIQNNRSKVPLTKWILDNYSKLAVHNKTIADIIICTIADITIVQCPSVLRCLFVVNHNPQR